MRQSLRLSIRISRQGRSECGALSDRRCLRREPIRASRLQTYTSSIDACIVLAERVLPECGGQVFFGRVGSGKLQARVFRGLKPSIYGEAATPALALLAAVLAALIAKESK